MPNENGEEVVRQAATSLVEGSQDGCQASTGALTSKRPYKAPELRSLGKVAELTFNGSGSVTDHVGGLKQSAGAH
jgi:hypothetical protein